MGFEMETSLTPHPPIMCLIKLVSLWLAETISGILLKKKKNQHWLLLSQLPSRVFVPFAENLAPRGVVWLRPWPGRSTFLRLPANLGQGPHFQGPLTRA